MIKFLFKFGLFLLLMTFFVNVQGRSYHLDKFTMLDGLPNNTINDIYEDSRGVVWLATNAGLYEFNGKEINFRDDLYKLQGEHVSSVCENAKGELIIATMSRGLFRYDGKKMYELHTTHETKGITVLDYKESGKIRAISNVNIIEFDEDSLVDEVIFNEGFQYARKRSDKTFLFKKSSTGASILNEKNQLLEEESIPEVVIGEQKGIFSISNYSQIIVRDKNQSYTCDVLESCESKDAQFFLLRYIEKGREQRKIISVSKGQIVDFSSRYDLNSFFVTSLYVRKNAGNLWIGTKNNGILCAKKSNFSYYTSEFLTGTQKEIKTFVSDQKGTFYIAFADEIVIFKDAKVFDRIQVCKLCSQLNACEKCDKDLIISDIQLDYDDRLWISSNKGFFLIENNHPVYVGIVRAEKFVFASKDVIFYSVDNFLKFVSIKGQKINRTPYFFSDSTSVEISKILKHKSDIWVATKQQGVVKYSEGKFYAFNRENSKIHNVVNDLLVMPDSSVILGGNNGVIYRLKDHSNHLNLIDSISYKDGLKGISVHGFQYLKTGYLWCGTNLGVHRFNFKTLRTENQEKPLFWNSNDGFSNQEATTSLIDKDGDIWVLTHNRLIKVNTELEKSNHLNCSLYLRQIDILGKPSNQFEKNPWTSVLIDPITLKYSQKNLTFHFGIGFCASPDNLQFRYRLEGLDDDWSVWTKSRKAIYTNLRSGEYTLHFEGKELGTGNIFQVSYQIIIVKPWWQELWFLIINVFVLAVLICWASRQYARNIRKKENKRTKQFKRVLNLKMQALQNQLDPHFIFNSLNSIQSYILDDKSDDALEYLNDFSMVLRKNIDHANKNFIALSEEVNYLRNYLKLEQMRFSEHFTYEVTFDENMNLSKLKIPPMLIHPFVENAIRYGLSALDEDGKLSIHFFEKENGFVSCLMEDNGIGRDKAWQIQNASNIQDHNKSMEIIDGRIKLLNQVVGNGEKFFYKVEDLYGEDGKATGTRVQLGFPQIT